MRSSPGVRRAAVSPFPRAVIHEASASVDVGASTAQDSSDEGNGLVPSPSAHAANAQQIRTPQVTLRPLTTEDVDQLWDWSRTDPEGVTACFGHVAKNSRDLFNGIGKLADMQTRGESWINAITRDAALIGFVLVAPIQRPANQPPVGTVHLYIAQGWRGEIAAVVTGMLDAFDQLHVPMTLSVIVNRPEWIAVLEPLGFTASTVLTRPALTSDAHGS